MFFRDENLSILINKLVIFNACRGQAKGLSFFLFGGHAENRIVAISACEVGLAASGIANNRLDVIDYKCHVTT